ncbi:MAG: hypothetical protein JSU63_12485 [Phycisphaerales bacterium]|nr:MAG: hypothetical protein JSU63_12485 [Phycisphaerales bacterium]
MDSIAEAKLKKFLQNKFKYLPNDCRAACFNIRRLAHKGGFQVDHRFAQSGLAAGPEASVAAGIVAHALGFGGGGATADYTMKATIDLWIRTTASTGV